MKASRRPKQARSRDTYEKLVAMAQEVLEEVGIEGFNSNLIVERLGMTPPAFYRYFPNKYALLTELGERLMAVQNELIENFEVRTDGTKKQFIEDVSGITRATVEVTRQFRGGYALLVSLRAIPELRPVRLNSHEKMAKINAENMRKMGFADKEDILISKSRMLIEIGYGAMELLFETGFKNEQIIIESVAKAHAGILGLND
jgi:AcrR family transcriptional regulator